jgi:hypothetical protein
LFPIGMNRNLYLAALRVAARLTDGMDCSPEDLSLLRRNALPHELDLPLDLLCCQVIQRELEGPKGRRGPVASSK